MRRKISEFCKTLNRSIFVGERHEKNMRNIAMSALIIMTMGFVMSLLNTVQGQYIIALSPMTIMAAGMISFISVVRFKRREGAIVATMLAVVIVLTYDVLLADNGFAYMWTLLVPLSVSYMFSVKTGILLTAYFQTLLIVVFYTPVRQFVSQRYTETVMSRFPLLFFFSSLLTLYVMVQYHRSVLFEIEHTDRLNEEVARQTAVARERSRRIEEMSFQTIQTLANAIDAKDPYTRGHSIRVSQYSVMIADRLGWDRKRVDELRYGALLHDIGKIGVPDSILNNPRRLTEAEYAIIKSHTTMGGEILQNGTLIDIAEDVALSHHERYDGRGYPRGLAGKAISEEARIVAIADAFDAMSSNRIYRRACDRDHIRRELMEGRGRQFDPDYALVMIELWDQGTLDEILSENTAEDDGCMEESTALLRQAMARFAQENADVNQLTENMRGNAGYDGAMDVAYTEFEKLFEYISNLGRRFDHPFVLVMIVLEPNPDEKPGDEAREHAMYYMEHAIRQTIRNVDVVTRYGQQRFLVILLGAVAGDAQAAMDRVFRGYYKMNGSGAFSPTYTVASEV